MSEEQVIKLTEPVHYDNAEMCIAGAIKAAQKYGGKDISIKAKKNIPISSGDVRRIYIGACFHRNLFLFSEIILRILINDLQHELSKKRIELRALALFDLTSYYLLRKYLTIASV